jgi:fibronectin-binding autotransporter adhesin
VAVLLGATPAQAVTYWWDTDFVAPGINPGAGSWGGAWGGGNAYWATDSSGTGTGYHLWTDGYDADFAGNGTAYTVTVYSTQSVGNITFDTGGGYTLSGGTLSLGGGSIAVNTSDAAIASVIDGASGLTKTGAGVLTLSGPNIYTGTTTVNGGTLKLDFSAPGAPAANIINYSALSSDLTLGGGALTICGSASGSSNTQRFNGLTLAAGASTIQLNKNGNSNLPVLSLGAITATAAGGTLLLDLSLGGTITTTTAKSNGIYGGGRMVYYDGTNYNWVTTASSSSPYTLSAATTTTTLPTSGSSSAGNYLLAGNGSVTGTETVNTLKISPTAAGGTLTITAGKLLTLNAGGLLFTGTNDYATSGGSITAGTASGAYELIVQQYAANNNLTIGSAITDNGTHATSLIVTGPGTLTLAGSNTYTGSTTIVAGMLVISPSADWTYAGEINGAGSLTKAGSGTLTLSTANGYTGTTLVSGGTLLLADANAISGSTFDTSGGGSLSFDDLTSANFAGLQGSGDLSLSNASAAGVTLSVGSNNASTTFSGGLSGNGSLTKNGSGTFTVTGSNTYSGDTTVYAGTLQILAGQLPAANEYVGKYSTASVVHSGGTNLVSSALYLGYSSGNGTYNLSGSGQLSAPTEYIGSTYYGFNSWYDGHFWHWTYYANPGNGTFTQSGGTNAVSGTLYVGEGNGSVGTYTLSSGQLSAGSEYVGYIYASNIWYSTAQGTFTQSGGTNSVAGDLYVGTNFGGGNYYAVGTYNLSGSGLLSAANECIGDGNSGGYFNQSGGSNSVAGALYLGDGGQGYYNLSGSGLLSAATEYLGDGGPGGFTHSGGTNSVSGSLYLGYSSSGTYALSGTGQLSAHNEYVGYSASGSFTQSGGTNTISGSLVLAQNSGRVGTYNLNGGLLTLNGLTQGAGSGTFNCSGGTLQAGSTFSTSVPITLGMGGSDLIIDTNGNTLTLSGSIAPGGLFQPAGLQKIGSGTLILSGTNSYSGTTLLCGSIVFSANALGSINGIGGVGVNPGNGNTAWLVWGGGNNTTDLTAQSLGLTLLSGTTGFDLQGQTVTFGGVPGSTAIAGSGSLSIANGTLVFGNYSGLGTGPVALVNNGAGTGFLSFNRSSGTNIVANTISGVGGLIQAGSDTLTLTGSNSYSGGTTITSGTLSFASGALGTSGTISFNGGTLRWNDGNTQDISGRVAPIGAGYSAIIDTNANVVSFGSGLAGMGGLTKTGSGTLILSVPNSYYGTTAVNQGTLRLGIANAFLNTTFAALTLANGTGVALDLNGYTAAFGSIAGGGAAGGNVLLGSGTLSVGSDNSSTAFAGAINGSGGLTKVGNGNLTVSGTLSYTGTTTISGGTLTVAGTIGSEGGAVIVQSGATLVAQADIARAIQGNGVSSTITANTGDVSLGRASSFTGFNHAGTLTVGTNTVTLNSKGLASLGVLTSLGGGQINAPNGVVLGAGGNLVGSGTLSGRVAAYTGSAIAASGGNLALGNASSPIGFTSDGELYTDVNQVTLNDSNQAVLGALTQLGNGSSPGTLIATNGFLVDFGRNLVGQGTVQSSNTLAKAAIINGSVQGDSDTQRLTFTGYVKGVGTFSNATFSGTYSPGLSPASVNLQNVNFGPSNTLLVELGGTTAGSQYDTVSIGGNVGLGGTLQVALLGSFRPAHGNQFTVLSFDSRSGDFAATTGLDLGSRLTLVPQYDDNNLNLVLTAVQNGSGTWNVNQNGTASTPTKWANGLPNGVGDVATFGTVITQPRTVTVDVPTTLGRIVFDSAQKYTLAGTSAVTLNVASGNAGVEILAGSHEIAAPLTLASPSEFRVTRAIDTLTIVGPIGGAAGLTKSGDGVLDILGAINYGGDTTIAAGEMRVEQFNPATAATAHIDVQAGARLVADSIYADTLTIGAGSIVTIQAIPGGPLGNTFTAVPEPSTLVLLGICALGLLAYAWRRRKE